MQKAAKAKGTMTNFQQLFQMGQQVQARISQLQTELGNRTVTSSSGGGMVSVTADGRGQIRSVKIDPAVVVSDDVEMLEDLVLAAACAAACRRGNEKAVRRPQFAGPLSRP
jgi:hypothetical protein